VPVRSLVKASVWRYPLSVTEKLYYRDSSLLEFDAVVLEATSRDGHGEIVLDRTSFYPGGGGQPCDLGTLGGLKVAGMSEKGDLIAHIVEPAAALPAAGTRVHGSVDAARRRDFMEQHSGEHIFAQALMRAGGLETVSVHFSDDDTTIEVSAESIGENVLRDAEEIANAAIKENRKVILHEIDPSETSRFPLRRTPPEKGRLQIVEMDSYDYVACCGVHVRSTGEVFLIKVVSQEKIRGRVRIHLMVGHRALADYGRKIALAQNLGLILTCGEPFIHQRVQELLDGQKEAARELKRLQAVQAASDADASLSTARSMGGALCVRRLFKDAGGEYLKAFVERVTASPGRVCIAVDQGAESFQWIVAHSLDSGLELSAVLKGVLEIADAKGGGRGARMQGVGRKNDAVERFADALETGIARALGQEGTP
jgi:alanyl-tRNA synthetase